MLGILVAAPASRRNALSKLRSRKSQRDVFGIGCRRLPYAAAVWGDTAESFVLRSTSREFRAADRGRGAPSPYSAGRPPLRQTRSVPRRPRRPVHPRCPWRSRPAHPPRHHRTWVPRTPASHPSTRWRNPPLHRPEVDSRRHRPRTRPGEGALRGQRSSAGRVTWTLVFSNPFPLSKHDRRSSCNRCSLS